MLLEHATDLAGLAGQRWRKGPIAAEWEAILVPLDYDQAVSAFTTLRDSGAQRPPTVADFMAAYRRHGAQCPCGGSGRVMGEWCTCADALQLRRIEAAVMDPEEADKHREDWRQIPSAFRRLGLNNLADLRARGILPARSDSAA